MTTVIPGKLRVQPDGRVAGPTAVPITYNQPFPCVNGTPGVTGKMMGVVMHTMVGDLAGTITVFNEPGYNASAHFGVAQDGQIHQFGPVGLGWEAWAQMAGNAEWYSIEHADHGDPDNPLTDAQMTASAQLVECLSAFAGFPLQVSDSVLVKGYGVHHMGGAAWGGHTCPDVPPRHVRSAQRAEILRRAAEIRHPTAPLPSGQYHADGTASLAALAARQRLDVTALWWATAKLSAAPGPLERAYLNAGRWDAPMPAGMVMYLP